MLPGVRLIDLSVPLEHQAASEPLPAQIRYARHEGEGLRQMQQLLGVRPEDLVYSNGLRWAVEEVQALTHTGTHVDAPYHYGPTSEGRPARTIDQVPLEFGAPGSTASSTQAVQPAASTESTLTQASHASPSVGRAQPKLTTSQSPHPSRGPTCQPG